MSEESQSFTRPVIVVTVVKGDLAGLRRTRDSVMVQKYELLRHVVVAAELEGPLVDQLSEWAKNDSRFSYLLGCDKGVYSAMNFGLRECKAEEDWVLFLNAGDSFIDAKSLQQSMMAASPGVEWICGPVQLISVDTDEVNESKFDSRFDFSEFIFEKQSLCHQSVVASSVLLNKVGGFEEDLKIRADYELLARMASISHPQTYTQPMVRYQLGGLSSRNPFLNHKESFKVRKRNAIHFGVTNFENVFITCRNSTRSLLGVMARKMGLR